MFCTNCGAKLEGNESFCTQCGQPTRVMRPVQTSTPTNKVAASYAQTFSQAAPQELPFQDSRSIKPVYVIVAVVIAFIIAAAVAAAVITFAPGFMGGDQNAATSQSETQSEQSTSSDSSENKESQSSAASSSASEASDSKTAESDAATAKKTVTVKVITASGSTLTGTVGQDDSGYVIADSSTRKYTADEIRAMNLTDAELCIAWNEPYARAGYTFMNSGLTNYFNSCSWYHGTSSSVEVSAVAEENVATIRSVAEESATAKQWEDLAKN